MITIVYALIFALSVLYLLRYRFNIKKAAEISHEALYPRDEDEFASILIPVDWKEMGALNKQTKFYRFVHWGTIAALAVLAMLLGIILTTNWLNAAFLDVAYILFLIVSAVRHQGNLFVLPKGIILYGKYFSAHEVHSYQIEKIIKWHELYGLDSRANNAFKLTIVLKRKFIYRDYVVMKDLAHLGKIMALLNQLGIPGEVKMDQAKSPINNTEHL